MKTLVLAAIVLFSQRVTVVTTTLEDNGSVTTNIVDRWTFSADNSPLWRYQDMVQLPTNTPSTTVSNRAASRLVSWLPGVNEPTNDVNVVLP